ncbi:protein-disulfide reductase DsbD family protein [Xylophilus sp. GOD-11R]|uniref:protein-disulfide reductase DsbD family protein n=1 Tax=Xylophilus sp. GOD-11R TaxID=3089814 RepID=UPI00298C196C|nr:thioredoxin family protein [Xylophilus sp. GOD-11R]WPB57840.1 thioredoxin family protein [Xylophilus sp. GOD-11R]
MYRIAAQARRFLFAVLTLVAGGSACAQLLSTTRAPVAPASLETPHVRAELVVAAPEGVVPGGRFQAALRIVHQPHWHTYWLNPGDSGLPTQLNWTLPTGLSASAVHWPLPRRIPIGPLANYGYEDTVLLPVTIEVAPDFRPPIGRDSVLLSLQAQWLVCRQECIPEQGELALELPVRSSTAMQSAEFAAAAAARPQDLPSALTARVDADGLVLTTSALPAPLRGKTIEVFPETPGITEPSADPVQSWQDAAWTARIALAAHRSESPATLAVLLVATGPDGRREGWRGKAAVAGSWPPAAAVATVPAALQSALDDNGAASDVAPLPAQAAPLPTWLAALGAALVGGLLLNLMPCVFPVLAVKLVGFARHGTAPRTGRIAGLAYTAGVVLSFVALGALVLALRLAGVQLGWGFQLQSPAVVAGMAALFTLLGLNLAGVFEFGMWVPRGLAGRAIHHPVADAFFSGALAVAIASPCTAPFMGASLGLALGLPAAQALPVFAVMGLGMALPYLLASWIPALAGALPKPGAWMETFRRLMAFPMFATVAWLVWVLGQQAGIDGAGALLLLLVAGAAVIWALGLHGGGRAWLGSGLAVVFIALAVTLGPRAVQALPPGPVGVSADANARWQPWSEERTRTLLAEGRPVFVDFTASWCVTCQVNERTTLADAGVVAAFEQKRVATLRADWTRQDPAITRALRSLGRSGVPVYVLHAPGRPPQVLTELLGRDEVKAALAALPDR